MASKPVTRGRSAYLASATSRIRRLHVLVDHDVMFRCCICLQDILLYSRNVKITNTFEGFFIRKRSHYLTRCIIDGVENKTDLGKEDEVITIRGILQLGRTA
jgi:hypothetical protein